MPPSVSGPAGRGSEREEPADERKETSRPLQGCGCRIAYLTDEVDIDGLTRSVDRVRVVAERIETPIGRVLFGVTRSSR